VLTGLGFSEADYQLSIDHLSGGQRTRGFLARLLLSDPDLLLLDEPTNHLDIAAVEWLEGYLSQWEGAAIIVSHDRYFLDKASNVILEMFPGATEMYRGNYSAYLKQRAERAARRQEIFDSEKEKLMKEVEYIRKNVAGQNVLQAKGKLKRLSRIIQAVEQIGMEAALSKKWSETASEVSVQTSVLGVDEADRRVRAHRISSPHRRATGLADHQRLGIVLSSCKQTSCHVAESSHIPGRDICRGVVLSGEGGLPHSHLTRSVGSLSTLIGIGQGRARVYSG
jgi:ATP-binding cassette subfamily F protein 3